MKYNPKYSVVTGIDTQTVLTRVIVNNKNNKETFDIVHAYIKDGADPNAPCINNKNSTLLSPLVLCCSNIFGKYGFKIVKLLVDSGALINPVYTSPNIKSPLMSTLSFDKTEFAPQVIKYLLDNDNEDYVHNEYDVLDIFIDRYKGPKRNEVFEMLLAKYGKNNVNNIDNEDYDDID